jgi:hypothetical protein
MKFSNVLFSEIFEEFDRKQNRADRIAVLQKYGNTNIWFREFLNYAFNPKIMFDITEIPTYTPSTDPAGLSITSLSNEMRRLYVYIQGHPKRTVKLDPKREKRLLSILLSTLHKDEADLLVKLFHKKLEIRYLSARIVKEAFPTLPFTVEPKPEPAPVVLTPEPAAPKAKKLKVGV